MASWQGTYHFQCKTHRQCEFGRSTPWHRALGHCMPGCHASRRSSPQYLPTRWCVSGHFLSRRSCVRVFLLWTQPCQGIFLLDGVVSWQMVSRRHVLWHRGHTGRQRTEDRSKYSRRIRKHAVGFRHRDSVWFYSFYLMYIYICYYHTSFGNKGTLAYMIRHVEHNAMSTI